MKIEQQETVKSYFNNHLNEIYLHYLPKWIQFIVFLYRGVYNGYTSFNLNRVLCWYGKHNWGNCKYDKWEDGTKLNKYHKQCRRCGIPSKIYNYD